MNLNVQVRISAGLSIAAASILVWCSGCSEQTSRIPVSGKVQVAGHLLDNAAITFLPLSTTAAPSASTGVSKGRYHFTEKNGPVPGKYRVVVRLSPPGKDDPPVVAGSDERRSWENEVEVPSTNPCEIDIELD